MCLQILKYNISDQQYNGTKRVVLEANVNGLVVYNAGNTDVYWNGSIIVPGASKTVGGNYGEIFVGTCDLIFRTPSGLADPPVNLAIVTQKWYTDLKVSK